ncbi:MAG: DNA polymerase III subunit delta [Clostridia bacterium]|nr:DNA polymerase III subunit delta [Clostridia bacterium]
MNHTAFFKCIKDGTLHGAYLLQGKEERVKESAVQRVMETVEEAARDLNVQIFSALDAASLIAACETLPFFASRRLIVCRELPGKEQWERLSAYLPAMPDTTLLLFVVRGEANGTLAAVKAFKADNALVSFDILNEAEAVIWVQQQTKKYDATISPMAARYLVKVVGCELGELGNELAKAAGYAGAGQEITRKIIDIAVTRNIEYGVFAMMDCLLAGKTADGLRALSSLLEQGNAFSIASLLAGRFKQMLQAKLYMEKGLDKKTVVAKLGGSAYAAGLSYEAAKRYTKEMLIRNVKAFSDVGFLQVTGQMKDRDALEQAVLHCAPQRS